MAAPTVFEDVAEGFGLDGVGQLFADLKFWVAQRVPSRNRLLDDIKANGGEIVALEKKADYRIADHFRKDCPPGTISYEFVEKSIQEGQLRDPEDHRAGPPLGESREPGAINRPTKGGRAAYDAEEDRILYKWVRDCEANGGLSSGNEIYKQLEAKYPRHTWQSWRDRYIKQLRNRPPSAFNIPDDAPPSPPLDDPAERTRPTTSVPKQSTRPVVELEPAKVTGKGKARAKIAPTPDYSLDQLAATFSSEDWEELYAFVDVIDEIKGQKEYDEAWMSWAESKDNQTAEQWQQYYDKVVRPQWLRDPEWKRKEIAEKVEKKHADEAVASQLDKDTHDEDDEATLVAPAEREPTKPSEEVRRPSSEGAQAPHQATKTHTGDDTTKQSFDVKLMSSSTAQHESPKYIIDMRQNVLKRIRGEGVDEEQIGLPRSSKRVRSASPVIDHQTQQAAPTSTQAQPLEISSVESPILESQEGVEDEQVRDQIMQDMEQTQRGTDLTIGNDIGDADKEVESVESDDLPAIDVLDPTSSEPSEDDLPSNTPTPRASKHRPNNFDTQAILSSPSQEIHISRLPRPVGYTQDLADAETRSSSLAPHPESDASTTQSLQEFRRSLNGNDPSLAPLPRLRSLSLTPSATSSTDSGDPDPPLSASEMNAFFAEQNAAGFNDTFVAAALKRTRCRPDLADVVLEAWKEGKVLPSQRGIWSVEDDEAVESGDGAALARLEAKHSLDGWGGITERVRFLEGYRTG